MGRRRAVVVLTTSAHDEYVFGALRAGASAFLLKEVEPADLPAAVHLLAGAEALLAPALTRTLIAAFAGGPQRSPDRLGPAPDAHRRPARGHPLAGHGLDNGEIAGRAGRTCAAAR